MTKRLDSVIASTGVEPRPYQYQIVKKTTDMVAGRYRNGAGELEPEARSVLIESPTGSGKTVMGLLTAKVLQEEIGEDLVIGWVAMRRNLLTQAAAENLELGINVENIHFTSMFDKEPKELIEARKAGKKILMVVDEAQHDAASSMAHLHNKIEPDWILGLTATPFRTDKVKLCFDKVVKDAGIHQLIQDGFLSEFHHYSLPKWDAETVVEFYCREPELWGKSIFYFLTLDECHLAHRMLTERGPEILKRLRAVRDDLPLGGLVSEIVTGSSKESDREEQLTRFRAGETPCLVNCMVLTEGFDDPTLETAFVRDSVRGPTMQMAGRAFRMHPNWKTDRQESFQFKRVVQSRQTKWPILKTAMAAEQYLWQSEEWRSLTVNPHLNEINNRARMAIAQTEVALPDFIANKKGRSRRLRFDR
jgi:superfamily II DNA or RNA helicase